MVLKKKGNATSHISDSGNVQHCKILLEAERTHAQISWAWCTALRDVVRCGELVKLLLESAIPNLQDKAGLTALILLPETLFQRGLAMGTVAPSSPQKHLTKSGKRLGAKVGSHVPPAESPRKSFTQMPEASMISTMQHLVDFRANFHMPDQHGRTPLHIAAYMAPPQVVAQMLNHGGDPRAKDYFNETPLHIAVRSPLYSAEVCDLLLNKVEGDADYFNMPNNNGDTPLHIVCKVSHSDSVEVISKLLKSGSYPNNVNNLSYAPCTCLHATLFQVQSK